MAEYHEFAILPGSFPWKSRILLSDNQCEVDLGLADLKEEVRSTLRLFSREQTPKYVLDSLYYVKWQAWMEIAAAYLETDFQQTEVSSATWVRFSEQRCRLQSLVLNHLLLLASVTRLWRI